MWNEGLFRTPFISSKREAFSEMLSGRETYHVLRKQNISYAKGIYHFVCGANDPPAPKILLQTKRVYDRIKHKLL